MFKLIPIKDFEKSDLNKDPKCDKGNDDSADEINAPQRSIKDIIDSNSLENTEFEPIPPKFYREYFFMIWNISYHGATYIFCPNG